MDGGAHSALVVKDPLGRGVGGPGSFFSEHPAAFALSLAGAGTAIGMFAWRAARARGARRLGWAALFALEVVIFVGIVVAREDARR